MCYIESRSIDVVMQASRYLILVWLICDNIHSRLNVFFHTLTLVFISIETDVTEWGVKK